MKTTFNILAISGSAMFAGVMFAIGMILGNYWQALTPAEFLNWFSQYSDMIRGAIPPVVLPTVIGLAGSLFYDWRNTVSRNLWLGASVCIAVIAVLTFTYFVPNNAAFADQSIALGQVTGALNSWLATHNIRIALAVIASVLGIVAIRSSK